MGPGRKYARVHMDLKNGKSGRHRVLTRVEFQKMIYHLATLVECSLKFPSFSHLICIINGLRGRRKKGRGMGKETSAKAEKREVSACYKSRSFCIPPTIFSTNPITSTDNT